MTVTPVSTTETVLTRVWLALWAGPWLLLAWWMAGNSADLLTPAGLVISGVYLTVMTAGYLAVTRPVRMSP